jgi:hypothetical protein
LYRHRACEQVNSAFGCAETEAGDCRCEHYGIVCGIVPTYARYSQRVRTNANLAKDFVKVKTYSDLIVLKQVAHDKLGEPARWVLYAADFDKSPNPAMHKDRAE